jgi:hypothetical protein
MASVAWSARRSGARGRPPSARIRFLDWLRLAVWATARPRSSDPGNKEALLLHATLKLTGMWPPPTRVYSPNLAERRGYSRKFAVASNPSSLATNASPRPGGTPSAPKRGSYVPFVAPLCIKRLRLVTMQLPENYGPSDRNSIKLRLYGFLRGSLADCQIVPLGKGLIALHTKIIRLGDARLLFREHHDRRGKGNLLARPERKSGVLPGVPGE